MGHAAGRRRGSMVAVQDVVKERERTCITRGMIDSQGPVKPPLFSFCFFAFQIIMGRLLPVFF